MKPSVRPPIGTKASTIGITKTTNAYGALNSEKVISGANKVETKPIGKYDGKGIQKTPSYGNLKSNIGATSSKQITKVNKLITSNAINPEVKHKPNIPSSSVKSGLTYKPPVSSIQKSENLPISSNKPTLSQNNLSQKPKVQAPVKKSVGPPSRFQQAVQQDLEACKQCGRTFNEKALARHEKICKKVFSQKRKQFNSAKQRVIQKQQVPLLKKNNQTNKLQSQQSKNILKPTSGIAKWKQESLAFQAAMKQARGQTLSANEAQQFHQQASSQLIPCKFCGKKFAQQPHGKHIVFCERKSKQLALMKKKR